MVATTRIICSGVLEDFPDLTFVISHRGGGIVAVKERIEHWFGAPGAPGTRMHLSFEEYFQRLYFNLAGSYGGMNSIRFALAGIRTDRLIFGTDYPQEFHEDLEGLKTFMREVQGLDVDPVGLELMIGGNAQKLLGL